MKNVIDMLNRTIPTEAIVLDTEKVIITLTEGITEISDKHKTYAGEALRDMIWIKHNLRTSRLGLEDLAHRTISTVDELTEYSEYLFADDADDNTKMEIIYEKVRLMKDLIEDTNAHIKKAKEIQEEVMQRMSSVKQKLVSYKYTVEQLLSNRTSASDKVARTTGWAVAGGAATSTTVCIIVDFSGGMGVCSIINGVVVGASALTAAGVLIDMRQQLEVLQGKGETAINLVATMITAHADVEKYLVKEEKSLIDWKRAMDAVERKVSDKKRLTFILQGSKISQKLYLKSLRELRTAAQNYIELGEAQDKIQANIWKDLLALETGLEQNKEKAVEIVN